MKEIAGEHRGVQVVDLGGAAQQEQVLNALGNVIDPELGLDVVSLGLIYELHLADSSVTVIMTLTTPGCPLHGTISRDVESRLGKVKGVDVVDVQLVWDPAWTPARITPEGRERLGWLPHEP